MAVGFDAVMTGGNSSDGDCQQIAASTTISSTGMTTGASATLLIAVLHWQNDSGGSRTCTWNGVSMTEAISVLNSTLSRSSIFYLVNPAIGNKTLAASWANSVDCYMSAVSFTGTNTSTGIQTADNVSGTTGTTVTVTSTTDGATVAAWGTNGSSPTLNFTKIYDNAPLNPGAGASYALGGTSNGHTFTGAGGTAPAWTGVHVIAGSAASDFPLNPRAGMDTAMMGT